MLTRKQQKARKQERLLEQSKVAKLSRELGRNPDGSARRIKKDVGKSYSVAHAPREDTYKSAQEHEVCDTFEPEVENHAEREALAQKEIERKKKCTAPLWNKGGYMYVSDAEDPTTIGKKV